MYLDVLFRALGDRLPIDHSYQLYSALSRIVPAFHDPTARVRFAPVTGVADGPGVLRLAPHSLLRVRLPADAVGVVLPLAGRAVSLGDHTVRFGPPSVATLAPAASLHARLVTFKNADTLEAFLATARTKLAELGVSGEPQVPIHAAGSRAGEPTRRVVRIRGAAVTGYALIVAGLSAPDSVTLQEAGLGGRTRLGCGFFTPAKESR